MEIDSHATLESTAPAAGTLVLVPNALDLGADPVDLRAVLADGAIRRAASLRHWAAENARSARAFLKRVAAIVPLALPLQEIAIAELPRARKGSGQPVPTSEWHDLLQPALQGHDLGLISDAGLPAVADPGAALVQAAHRAGVPVLALPGASSLLMALAASGLNGQSFAFVGYLPQDGDARGQRLKELEALSRRASQTQLLIETPYRNQAMWMAMLAALAPQTQVTVSCGLSLPSGWSRTDSVAGWRRGAAPLPPPWPRMPAVFGLLAS
ncbi:MAG: SAM-dependent methyltransferase [Rubrivivax sp.]